MFRYFIAPILMFLFLANIEAQTISSDVLDHFNFEDRVDCIIVMDDQLDLYGQTNGMTKDRKAEYVFNRLQNHAINSQKDIKHYLQNANIGFKEFYVFNGLQARLDYDQTLDIIQNFNVKTIVYNEPARVAEIGKSIPNQDRNVAEWGILQIKADSVWQLGYKGEGVVVGGQDTGYDFDNSLIVSKYRGYTSESFDHNYNWHDAIDTVNVLNNDTINDPSVNPCGFLSDEPCDDHGHGTHTMGTMVGSDSINEIGVAPAATWIGCRNMDRGWGKPSTYTECFEWFLAPTDMQGQNPDPTKAPHVINNSWGCPTQEGCNSTNWAFMETVVNNLNAAGTVVVVSAGNSGGEGCGSVSNPAAIFENSFSVGASNQSDDKAGFSSIGPVTVDSTFRIKPDVVAPGTQVRSIYLNEEFRTWNGTSMAGPHVAGAAALIINANPILAGQVDEIKNILKVTAKPLIDSTECLGNLALEVPNFYFGHGRIDVLAAVKMATEITSIDEQNSNQLVNVFPNPSEGTVSISCDYLTDINSIHIMDYTGRVVQSHEYESDGSSRSISGLLPGMYIYSVKTSQGISNGKLVVVQ